MNKRWTKDEDEKLTRVYNLHSIKEIAKIFNRSTTSIYTRASSLNLSHQNYNRLFMSDKSRKYTLNERFFDNIDTEEKAYFLGLLYADGYNKEKKGVIEISLHKRDKDILELFKVCLETNRPLYEYKDDRKGRKTIKTVLSFNSLHMSKALVNLGCMQAKTKKIKFPFFIRRDLIRHFIRGYFDGDGSVFIGKGKTVHKKKTYHRLIPTVSFASNERFIIELRATILLMANIYYSNITKDNRTNIYYASFYNDNALELLEWLYRGSKIALKRKSKIYEEINNIYSKRKGVMV